MGFLGKVLKVISMIPSILVGIENLFGAKSGAQKQSTAIEFVGTAIGFAEGIAAKDIMDQEKFQAGLKKVIDGTVEMLNASVWYKK